MHYYSTNRKSPPVTLKAAVLKGLADDGGLFMPEMIPELDRDFFRRMPALAFQEIAFEAASALMGDDVPAPRLQDMITKAFNFDAPLVQIDEKTFALELFHGPTLAFKDFGARFMAQLMAYFVRDRDKEVTILVATSGDTGSAVAHGFLNVPGIRVLILYPSRKISVIQEKQLTTMGGNVTALEVEGSFDDCQRLVKQAFLDAGINRALALTSANSINIARLIPQSFYYFYAVAQLPASPGKVTISVPSGNFGNLTAGLLAKKMGLPVSKFIAATNINDIVPHYLDTGQFKPRPMRKTISNAMDVGNPSNFARILELYRRDLPQIRADILGVSLTDAQTRQAIRAVFENCGYILDPHGAVGYLGLKHFQPNDPKDFSGIFVETAHPAKFVDIVGEVIAREIEIPERLKAYLSKEKQAIRISTAFSEFKNYLMADSC